jgi:hypothetical protein
VPANELKQVELAQTIIGAGTPFLGPDEFRRQLELLRITHAQHLRFKTAVPALHSPQRSLFIATLPKSGTEFVSGAIRDATELISPMAQWDEDLVRAYFSGYCNREHIYSNRRFCVRAAFCSNRSAG